MSLSNLIPLEVWREQHAALFPSPESLRWFTRQHPKLPIVLLRGRKHVDAVKFTTAVEKAIGAR